MKVGARSLNVDNRLNYWKETLHVAAEYPLTGSGLGTFVSAVAKFRRVSPTKTLEYAHNDALQLLAEGGVIGAFIGLAGFVLLFRRLAQAWPIGARRAELPLACGIALLAAIGHSLVDFTFHIPACALAFSWIAGMSAGLRFSPPVPTHRPRVLTQDLLAHFRR